MSRELHRCGFVKSSWYVFIRRNASLQNTDGWVWLVYKATLYVAWWSIVVRKMHKECKSTTPPPAVIKVIGVGGCGCNAVEHLIRTGETGVEYIFASTDFRTRNTGLPAHRIQLDSSEACAMESVVHEFKAAITGAQVLCIAAGLGGHAGGTYAHVIASAAREMGIRTFGILFTPFDFEGQKRYDRAAASLRLLDASLNMMTVVSNEKLLAVCGNVSQKAAFSIANEVLANAVRGMVDIAAAMPRLMECEDYCRVLQMPGRALIGSASAIGPFQANIAFARALECPLVADQDLLNAKAALILLTVAENSLKLGEFLQARNMVIAHWPSNIPIVFETACDTTLQNEVRVAVMVTGISSGP